MSEFQKFSKAVHDRYFQLTSNELFTVGVRDTISDVYLAAFPAGTNPVYITNTEHDCSCCKNFIKNLGSVVAIINGKVQTIWDPAHLKGLPYPYDVVAQALHEFVLAQPIKGIFRSSEKSYGAESTLQAMPYGGTKKWNHFHGVVGDKHYTKDVGAQVGKAASSVAVFKRGLEELTQDSLQQIKELIESNGLYRGQEHLHAVKAFMVAQAKYLKLDAKGRELFLWANYAASTTHFRNTVIGTLAQDLSTTGDLEGSVKSFEAKVAPANYKRPTALVTPKMVESAMKTIRDLGLEESLERRMARISDVNVNNVLWVNNETKSQMKGGLENILMASAKTNVKAKETKAESIGIEDFMTKVLPGVSDMEILVKNTHQGHFMTLTAPVHEGATDLFKWDNGFAWSYEGNVTDSIKEKVKRAGGNVTNAALRVSLAWSNLDDLDLHCHAPHGHIYYANKGTILDVDMNAGYSGTKTRTPVENMSFKQRDLRNGVYRFMVNQYSKRETTDVGFELEIEAAGQLHHFRYAPAVVGTIAAITIKVNNGVVTDITANDEKLVGGSFSQEKWGITTEQFVKVKTLLNSPNYWDGQAIGNKHWFFILEGCMNDSPARGIYNEFLKPELDVHRKVFELLGDKTKCAPTTDQLSGLGFSSTTGTKVTVQVTGVKLRKQYEIQF